VAAVALANKNARVIWALLAHDRRYQLRTSLRHDHSWRGEVTMEKAHRFERLNQVLL